MALRLDDRARVYLVATVRITTDPASATVALLLDEDTAAEQTLPMTWVGAATSGIDSSGDAVWTRTARTNSPVAGPSADPTSAVTLAAGDHTAQVLVTLPDTQVLPARDTLIRMSAV